MFVEWFRSAAPYIHAFRGRTFVIACGGEVIADGRFVALSHELNLLAALGVRIVLAFGTRTQIDALLKERKHRTRYRNGVRVTDAAALKCVKEAVGSVRADIEASLSTGLPNSPMAGADIRVASGNFVTAKPLGVIDGIDMLHTGEVRKVDAIGIRAALDTGAIVLLPPLGYSPTGEMFNITVENVAARAAIALKADKLLFLVDTLGVERARGGLIRELPVAEGERLLRRERRHDARVAASALESGRGVSPLTPSPSPKGRGERRVPADAGRFPGSKVAEDIHLFLPHALEACRGGVNRVHLVSRHLDGALLLELFTRDGVGTMVVRHSLDHLRSATIEDVGAVLALIAPLEAEGSLVKRGRKLLEMEIDRFSVLEHDGMIVGCAALYPYPPARAGELACLAVHPDYRDAGHGASLLEMIEAKARADGIERLFVLTTRTAHWFIEHGFSEAGVDALPAAKQAMYNWQRRSKILAKALAARSASG
ncbi:MAG: amino-acid N-acetyltransferase [Betaproteobacteria bacterium]|nr:amino-acid N-acetyltransferase [Betaproteobacteria bacterium]